MTDETGTDSYAFPMSYGQSQLWYLHEMDPESTAYNIPFAFRYSGRLDVEALRRALQELVNRFEPLRTNFVQLEGEPRQIIRPSRKVSFDIVKVSPDTCDSVEAVIRQSIDDEARSPFDLQNDLMVRARLLVIDELDSVLLLSFHHIAVDHIAVLRLKRELEDIYAALIAGSSPPTPREEIQYADFTIWQLDTIQGDALEERLSYWSREFENRAGILPLPTDFPRPPAQTFSGAEIPFEFSPGVSEECRRFCKNARISPFVLLLAALKVLFFRYTRQSDITVGCPFANRVTEELEGVVGLFMNLLPIGTTVSGHSSFFELLEVVKSSVISAQRYQDTPFERIVQQVAHDRDPAYNPMLQTWFTFQEAPMVLELAGLTVESLPVHNGGAKLDLSFWLWDDGEKIRGLVEYNRDLFLADTVSRLTTHYESIVSSAIRQPEARVDELDVLTEDEKNQLLVTWGSAKRPYDPTPVPYLLEQVARANSDRIAVSSPSGSYSYAQFDAQSEHIRQLLEASDIPTDRFVAVCADRKPGMISALAGVWRHGAAYLPLDPAFPDERLLFMVRDSGAAVIIADPDKVGRFAEAGVPVIGLPEDVASIPDSPSNIGVGTVEPESTAYVIYTSGSTGKPKGVKVSHRAVKNFLSSMQETPGLGEGDILAAVTTISFDISILELFLPLISGAQVHLIPREITSDGKALAEEITRCNATVLQATPSMLRLLVDAGWSGGPHLRILSGGEPLPKDLAARLHGRCGELWNMYGPTETTVWSTVSRIDSPESEITIGRPIGNTVVRNLDSNLQPVPIGIPGELFIGGDSVADGYINQPALNEEKFIRDPYGGPNDRLYRTGDTVRWRSDGQLLHLGRNDRQVKLRGFRIELEEIESILLEHGDCKNAAVVTWEAAPGDIRLVAYVVPRRGSSVSGVKFRKSLRQKLPDYMIPQHFVELRDLPMTANEKVDRKRLPNPLTSAPSSDKPKPTGETEKLMAKVWEDVIGRSDIARDDNFFEIGGHSLVAMKVISEVERRTGYRLTARMIVMQTLSELADILDKSGARMTPESNETENQYKSNVT